MKRINSIVKHELRKSLCNKFGGKCAYCERQIGMRGTIDHYLPQVLGGTNERGNLRWCCPECNIAKADLHPDEWEQRRPVPVASTTKADRRIALLASCAAQRRAA